MLATLPCHGCLGAGDDGRLSDEVTHYFIVNECMFHFIIWCKWHNCYILHILNLSSIFLFSAFYMHENLVAQIFLSRLLLLVLVVQSSIIVIYVRSAHLTNVRRVLEPGTTDIVITNGKTKTIRTYLCNYFLTKISLY